MASDQSAAAGYRPPAQLVGKAFVQQYYQVLHQSPQLVHRFYQESSKLGRPDDDGVMDSVTTVEAINEKILAAMDYSEFSAEIKTVDAQESLNGGVTVLVTGCLIVKDLVKKDFTQSFFLAPQDNRYFVLNDMFRFVDEVHQLGNGVLANGTVAATQSSEQDSPPPQELVIQEQIPPSTSEEDEGNGEEVYNPPEKEEEKVEDPAIVEEEVPVGEVIDEVLSESQAMVSDAIPATGNEEAPKKSYTLIVRDHASVCLTRIAKASASFLEKLDGLCNHVSGGLIFLRNTVVQASLTPSTYKCLIGLLSTCASGSPLVQKILPLLRISGILTDILSDTGRAANMSVSPALTRAGFPAHNSNDGIEDNNVQEAIGIEDNNVQEAKAACYSIYVKSLPLSATPAELEDEFKKFGPIKPGGIQVISHRTQQFCFGFVEFEAANAVQSAIKASPVTIGGRQAFVEEKRTTTTRANNRERFAPGRGAGFHSDGARGRGTYGSGRSYGRGLYYNGIGCLQSSANNRGRFAPGRGAGFRSDGARGRGTYGSGGSYDRGDFGNRGGGRANNRGRFARGRGAGFRSDGARGRGIYGSGRSYGRGDFGNRGGGRGGFSSW